MAQKKFSELEAGAVDGTSIFAQTKTENGSLVSKGATASALAGYIGTSHQFAGLNTDAKDIIGAVNEAAQSGGGASVIQLTQAEYTALSTAEKMNGSIYKLTDKAVMYCLDEEYHALKELTSAQYEDLSTAEKNNGTLYIKTDAETTASDIPMSSSDSTTVAEAIGAFKFLNVSETIPSLVQWGGVYGCDLTFDISSLGLTETPRFVGIVKGNTPYNWMINITNYSASSVSVMLHRGTNTGGGTQFVGVLMVVS